METGERMKEQLISIIVPVYNGETYLNRCVQSILAQAYSDWELLLIDGASTDRTPALCDAWQQKDERIRVFHAEKNRGVSEGRNSGMREAQGEYLMFVDADDWLLPDCLQRLYQDMQISGVEIAGCSFLSCTDEDWDKLQKNAKNGQINAQTNQINAQGIQGSISCEEESPKLIAGEDFLKEGILKRDTRCWSKLYRRSVVEGHFFREDYTIGEDMLFIWEVTKGAKFVSSSIYPGYCYYYNVNGAMLSPFRKTDIDQVRCWQFLLDALQQENAGMKEQGRTAEQGRMGIYDNDVISETASILLISCMLVAGKLALLPGNTRIEHEDIRAKCSQVLQEALRIPGAYERLDRGYRIKVRIYEKVPKLYLTLYHTGKKVAMLWAGQNRRRRISSSVISVIS